MIILASSGENILIIMEQVKDANNIIERYLIVLVNYSIITAISFNFMEQNKHFNKLIVFRIYKTFNMIIILKGTIDAYKAAKDFRENQCISSDVILMFDETTEKLLLDDLSDVNSIRLGNVAGNIAPKAVDELNYCCVNMIKD